MKNIMFSIVFVLIAVVSAYSQTPQNFNYQAVVRDGSGMTINNSQVSFRFTIVENSANGNLLYQEIQKPFTTDNGIVSLQIGAGNNTTGTFSNINWANGNFWLKIELDMNGGNNFQLMGSSQLVSVPFAMHAATVDNTDDADADPSNELQNLAFDANTNELSISGGNIITIPVGGPDADADPENELQQLSKMGNLVTLSRNGGTISVDDGDANPMNEIQTLSKNGNTVSLSNNGGSFTDETDDADADPNNEIQSLSFDPNTNELSISNSNSITIPSGGADADPDPTNEIQTLSKNGNLVSLSNNGGSFTDAVDDADADPQNEIQTLSKNGNLVSLSGNGGSFTDEVNDADADITNELQTLSFDVSTNELSISNGNSIAIPTVGADADADPTNEIQQITRVGDELHLSENGGIVSLQDGDSDNSNELQMLDYDPDSSFLTISNGNTIVLPKPGPDADSDPFNELQNLTLAGTQLIITDGNSVDLTPILPPGGTDDQNLTLNGNDLSIENGNSVDLSSFATPWKEVQGSPGTINYDEGNVLIKNQQSGENVNIFPYAIGVSDGMARNSFLNPYQAKFQSSNETHVADFGYRGAHFYNPGLPFVETLAKFDKDSLHFYHPGAGLILPNRAKMDAFGLHFDNTADRAGYNFWGMEVETGDMAVNLTPYALEGTQKNIGGSLFTRYFLGKDSLTLWNDSKWKNAWMGTEANGSGGIKLFSGLNDRKVVEITGIPGQDPFNPNPSPGGNIYLYDSNENLRTAIQSNDDAGWVSLVGDTTANLIDNNTIVLGDKNAFGPGTNFFVRPRVMIGIDHGPDYHGYLGIIDSSGAMSSGINVHNGSPRVFSKGNLSVLFENGDEASISDYWGYTLLGPNGNSALSLTRDIISPQVGYMGTNGENNFPNVDIGANYIDDNLNGGLVTVMDNLGQSGAGMKINASNLGTLWSNWDVAVEDDGTRFSSMNPFSVNVHNPVEGFSASMYRDIFTQDGILKLYDGEGSLNFSAGPDPSPLGLEGAGYAAIYDQNDVAQAGFYIDQDGNGVVFADLKPFRMDHPEDKEKEIWYVAMEGPEAGAYTRGTASLENGEAFVPFPEHFSYLATPESMTVILTPLSIDTYGLAVGEKTEKGIRVKELKGGNGSFEFDWEVKCVRKGHERFEVIRNKPTVKEMQPANMQFEQGN
ncbi:MAG: hypothetical protein R2879_01955 [Saprospiraceae bacterium]